MKKAKVRTVAPVSPGEILNKKFLKPLGLTKYRLAKSIGVPPQRIGDIAPDKRAVTADADLRLCKYFDLSDGWWLRGQANYDTDIARDSTAFVGAAIPNCIPVVVLALMQTNACCARFALARVNVSVREHACKSARRASVTSYVATGHRLFSRAHLRARRSNHFRG